MSEKDLALIRLLIESIDKIFIYTQNMENPQDFEKDSKGFDAVIMNFIVIGENISRLSDEVIDTYPEIEWRKIYAFRNVLAHDYFGILPDEVWEIIQSKLPEFKSNLIKILGHGK
jgi:uncharacterized protein with HEPN domain